ncbi:MAG TPA: response regulator transcription factor [Vicinamibacterales bacterium]|jgi:DNA-binding NarL/FixJ family response regulator
MRVLLVDDNPKIWSQVARALPPGFEIVQTLSSGEMLQASVEAHRPDVVVLDISMPGQSGIALASQLRTAGCKASVVFLTMHHDADYVRSALGTGAQGYVVKMRIALDLEPALRAAAAGERFISPIPELRVD